MTELSIEMKTQVALKDHSNAICKFVQNEKRSRWMNKNSFVHGCICAIIYAKLRESIKFKVNRTNKHTSPLFQTNISSPTDLSQQFLSITKFSALLLLCVISNFTPLFTCYWHSAAAARLLPLLKRNYGIDER